MPLDDRASHRHDFAIAGISVAVFAAIAADALGTAGWHLIPTSSESVAVESFGPSTRIAGARGVWVHYAPPIGDSRITSYRKLLRWNDEIPFAKFALATDDRPVLTAEVPMALLDRDELGLTLARTLSICDQLLEESAAWIWIGGRVPSTVGRESRQAALFARYAASLTAVVPAVPPRV